MDDRVEWFMENQLYVEAVECAVENQDALTNKSVQDIGKVLIEHLIQRKDFAAAASYLPQVAFLSEALHFGSPIPDLWSPQR